MLENDPNFSLLINYIKHNTPVLFNVLTEKNISIVNSYDYDDLKPTKDIVFLYQFNSKIKLPKKLEKNIFIFTFDTTLSGQPENHIFYYCFYLLMWANDPTRIGNINLVNTKYLFACASRNFNNYRPGKIYNYIKLKDKPYYEQILISKFQLEFPFELFYYDKEKDEELYHIVKQIEKEYYTWPIAYQDSVNNLINSVYTFDLPVYHDSLFHIVAETTVEELYLSEKTYKVFNAGQIPILCARKHAVKHLRDLGFDVFDDIIDHDYYDSVDNWKIRISRMHNVLDHLATLDHEKIKLDTYQRRLYNQQRLVSNELQKLIFDPIITQLKKNFLGE